MDEDIAFFDETFDPKFCDWLLEDARSALKSGHAFVRSNYGWQDDIVRASQPVLVRDYAAPHATFILGALYERGVISGTGYSVMCYAWSRMSYIPWHRDVRSASGVTVFINREWDRDWGGVFLYRDPRAEDWQVRGFVPRFNASLRAGNRIEHAVTMIAPDAPEPRFTLQLFQTPPE